MDKTAEQYIIDVLKQQLGLTDNQIWLRWQTRTVPNENGLYVVVGMVDSRPVSAQSYIEERENRPARILAENGDFLITENGDYLSDESEIFFREFEVQRVQTMDTIQIDIFSRDNSALLRRFEVMAALRSFQSQQIQEKNFFKISRLPASFLNTSGAEGGSNLNRFTLTFNCFVWFEKSTELPQLSGWFDDFRTRVDDHNTIGQPNGLIEFEIVGDTATPWKLLTEQGDAILTEDGAFLGLDLITYNGP